MKQKTIQLDKELEMIAQNDEKAFEPLQEVKLLLAGDHQQDVNLMRSLAGNSKLIQQEKIVGAQLELERFNSQYGKTFTIDQIKALAVKYHLRFLHSTKFKGDMDIQVISKVKEFAKEHEVSCLDEHSLGTKFFIMAPAESFHMTTRSLKSVRAQEKEEARRKLMLERDPILFYKIDQKHYRMIHKWGRDLTASRATMGWYWKNFKNYSKANRIAVGILFVLSAILMNVKLSTLSETETFQKYFNSGLVFSFANLLLLLVMGLVLAFRLGRVQKEGEPREALFGETNWDQSELILM